MGFKKNRFLSIVIFCFVGISCLKAQHSSVMLGGGLSTMRGDANLAIIDLDSYGYSFTLRYVYSFKENERWNITFEYTRSSMTQRGWTDLDLYHAKINQTYMGLGCRFYVTNTIKKYNPYLGELLPFVELGVGIIDNAMGFIEPFTGDPSVYEINPNSSSSINIQLTPGTLIVLNDQWSLELFAGFRYDGSDFYDGLKKGSGLGDIFGHGGLGVHYAF